ncbi:hypothetical protein RhiirA5_507567, partial [Rhizophagus irregularis]
MQNNSIYLIPNGYIPILIEKSLLKNHEKAVKSVDKFMMPLYVWDRFKVNSIKKTPNAFILFRNEKFKTVRMSNSNCSSREISKIIGNMWKQMSEKNKLPYQRKANEIKHNHMNLTPPPEKFFATINDIPDETTATINELLIDIDARQFFNTVVTTLNKYSIGSNNHRIVPSVLASSYYALQNH